jgi:hypothetical protein
MIACQISMPIIMPYGFKTKGFAVQSIIVGSANLLIVRTAHQVCSQLPSASREGHGSL